MTSNDPMLNLNKEKRNKGLVFRENKTPRGFDKILFNDDYLKKCSLQISSAMFKECIWLGIEDANPQIMATDAVRLGLITLNDLPPKNRTSGNMFSDSKPCGWLPYNIPEEVLLTTRMHLTRKQAKQLAEKLLQFAETGKIVNCNDKECE